MKNIVRACFFFTCLAISNFLFAQSSVKNYTFASAAGTYSPISGTNSSAVGDNGIENGIPIGFNFMYGGIGYTHFCISTNGFIKIGIASTTIGANDYMNSFINSGPMFTYYPLVAAFWDNNNRNTGSISYLTSGAVGSRVLTVQWNNVNIGSGDTSSTLFASFQIKLFEGTNLVKLIYSNQLNNAGPISASIGLNDNSSFLSVTPLPVDIVSSATANNNVNSLTNLSGKEYTFTPRTPLCSPVSSLTVSSITTTGAALTATTMPSATGYRFAVNTTGAYPTSSTLSSTPTFTLSGLTPNTLYYAQVQVVCSGGNSSAWFTTSFTTPCAVSTVPYFQNFDSVAAPTLPACFTKQDLNAATTWNNATASTVTTPYSLPNCMSFSSDPSVAANDWFYLPPMTLTAGTSYRLSFYYRNGSSVNAEKLEVKYGTAAVATSMTNTILRDTLINNTTYKVSEKDFTPPSSGTYYIGFHDFSNAGQVSLNIDDIRLTVTPTCGAPTLVNVTMNGPSTGVARWTAPTTGSVTGYQVAINTTGVTPTTGTATATNSFNLTGLVENKLYYLFVRSTCSTNSIWTSISFTPPCAVHQVPYFENFDTNVVVPALRACYEVQLVSGSSTWDTYNLISYSSPNYMRSANVLNLSPKNVWFFTPAIHLESGITYKLSYYNRVQSSANPARLEVKYGTANNAAAMTNLVRVDSNVNAGSFTLVTKNFNVAATGDYYFGFHDFSLATNKELMLDDLKIESLGSCTTATVPYVENFTTASLPDLPLCFTNYDLNGGNSWTTDSSVSCASTKAMVYKYHSSLPADDWAISQGISLTAGVSYEVKFSYSSCLGVQEQLEVKYGNANTVAAMSNLLFSNLNITQTAFQQAKAYFRPTTSGIYYIGFHAISPAGRGYLYVDSIQVNVSTSCGAPTNFSVNFTNNTDGTVRWRPTEEGNPTSYQYQISTSITPPATGTATTDTFATFSGLQSSRRYFLKVRSVCAIGGISSWNIYSFTTPCLPQSIPYRENFDSLPKPYLGNCMTLQDVNGGTTWVSDSINPRSAPNALVYRYSTTLPGDDWAYTPGLNLVAGTKYRLTYYYRGRSSSYNERIQVKYGNSPVADSMATFISSIANITNTTYQLSQNDFTPTTSGVYYIGFHATSPADQYDLNVDDITVDFAPGCGQPFSLRINTTSDTTANVSWDAPLNGPPTGYQYATSTLSTLPASGSPVGSTSFDMTELIPGVKYYIFVRSVCSGNVFSAWTKDSLYIPCAIRNVPFTENFDAIASPTLPPCVTAEDLNGGTTWMSKTFSPRSAPNSMTYNYSTTKPGDDWFYLPAINLTGGTKYRIKFFYKAASSSYTEKLEVKYGTSNSAAAMTNFIFADTNIHSMNYLLSETDFTPATTGVYYIGFHAMSPIDQFNLYVDDVSIQVAPNCDVPTNLAVVGTSNSTATASWDTASTGATHLYEYWYSSTNALPIASGIYTNNLTSSLVGLVPEKQYYLYVRNVCSELETSLWTVKPFTIPCFTHTLPYNENFDNAEIPALPPCMHVENIDGNGTWRTAEGNANSPYFSMKFSDPNNYGNDWFYTPEFNFTAGVTYRLSFYYKGENGDLGERLEVKYGQGNTAAAMTNLLMRDTTINFATYHLYETDFVAPSTGLYHIGFHAICTPGASGLYVDDIHLDVAPDCVKPTNLAVTATSSISATARWSAVSSGSSVYGYQYAITTTSALPVDVTPVTDTLVNLNSLIPEQQYYLHVRTACTGANGPVSLWASLPFVLPCAAFPIPYYQGFDSLFPPNLPPCITIQNVNGGNTWGTAEGNSNTPYVSMHYQQDNYTGDDWFYTPQFNFTAGTSYRFSFYYKALDAALIQKLEVKYGLNNTAAAMTNLLMRDTNINFTSYRYYQTDFVAPTTGLYHIGFHAISAPGASSLFVDDVKIDFSPNCSEPVNLVVRLIGGNGGTITWSPSTPGTPTGYEYVINTTAADPIGAGNPSPNNLLVLSNLNLFTQYYFHVRTICTNGNSSWVTTSFYTLPNDGPCNAINLQLNGPQSCGNSSMATVLHEPVLPAGCNPPNFTLWYKFTPTTNGRVILKTTIPNTNTPLIGSVGWFTLTGSCTDSAAYTLVPNSGCSPFGLEGVGDIDSLQSPVLTANTTYYIMISGYDYNNGDFCLNIISQPGNEQIYRFIGNGSWSDINNWENQLKPPANLPGGELIIIDNVAGGQCILDTMQYISTTGSIIVNTGKKLVIQGYLRVQ